MLVVALRDGQLLHHPALLQDGIPVLPDVAHPQLEQLDGVVLRMQPAVQVHQALDRLAPDPVERRVDVVHQHRQVVALHLRTDILVVDQGLEVAEERHEVALAALQLHPAVQRGGIGRVEEQGLAVIGQGLVVLAGGRLGIGHHREGVGIVVERGIHLDQLLHIMAGADLVVPGIIQGGEGIDVPRIGRIFLRGLLEMLLGGVEVPGRQFAHAEIVVDGVVFGVLGVQLRKDFPGLGDLSFRVGRGRGEEKTVRGLRLRPGGKTEQQDGQI